MANVQFYRGFDMSGADIVKYTGGDIDSQTTSSEHLSNGKYTGLIAGELNFYQTDTGQVTSFSGQHSQKDVLLITDFSVNNNQFASARHDAGQIYDLLLSGKDQIEGSQVNDHLYGFGGADLLKGNGGDDVLVGGGGGDSLVGGKGADAFTFLFLEDSGPAGGKDVIVDYHANDSIDLSAFGIEQGDIHTTYRAAKDLTTVHVDTDHDGKNDLVFTMEGDHRGHIDFVL